MTLRAVILNAGNCAGDELVISTPGRMLLEHDGSGWTDTVTIGRGCQVDVPYGTEPSASIEIIGRHGGAHLGFVNVVALETSGALSPRNQDHDDLLEFFASDRLLGGLRRRSSLFEAVAHHIVADCARNDADPAEVSAGLRELLEARDCIIRAHRKR